MTDLPDNLKGVINPMVDVETIQAIRDNIRSDMQREAERRLEDFEKALRHLINCHSMDSFFGFHDFVLAKYLVVSLSALTTVKDEEERLRG